MIFFFSGTGNSLWAAKVLGEKTGQPIKSIAAYKDENRVTCNDAVVGFVFPTYMMDLPWIAKEFLLKLSVSPDCYAFIVMTSSHGKSGKAFKNLDHALFVNGAHLSAGFNLQMPGNCLVSTEQENSARLQNAPSQLEQIIQAVENRKVNFKPDGRKPEKNFVSSSFFYGEKSLKRLTMMKNFIVTDKCDGCGICSSICPLDNIQISNGKAVHGNNCATCYACLHWCPQDAVWIDAPAVRHRPQYHHPDITLRPPLKTGRF